MDRPTPPSPDNAPPGSLSAPGRARGVEPRFGAFLDAAPDAMVVVGADGRIVLVNRQAEDLFGYERGELIGQAVELLVPGRFRSVHPGHRAGYVAEPRVRPMGIGLQLHARRKDGRELPVEISLSPLHTEDGLLVTAAIRDVTHQRALEAELRRKNEELEEQYHEVQEASRLKSAFLANMSHELRTPLNAIIGFAQLMHDGKVGPVSVDHKEYLGDILTSSRHLQRLIDDVLDMAKVESGKMEFRPEPVDLGRLIGEVRDLLGELAAGKRMRVEVELEPELEGISTDPRQLKRVVYNYLSNALKFTPDEGRVTIRGRGEDGERFRLEVEDTGIGIDKENLGRLFTEFRQLDASTAKRYAGTGLGLALTRRIVEAQGGAVGVESETGRGSTFFAVLPRVSRPRPAQGESPPPPRPDGPRHGG